MSSSTKLRGALSLLPKISFDIIFSGSSDLEQGRFERGTNSGRDRRALKDTHVLFHYLLSPMPSVATPLALSQAGRDIS